MFYRIKKVIQFTTILLLFTLTLQAQSGKVSGTVKDAETGDPLPGANIIIGEDNPVGAATNIDGEFIITGVSAGQHVLRVSYIGYQQKTIQIEVNEGETVFEDIVLRHRSLRGEDVIVTAQARAQTEAINQQISSETVKNVVSSSKIRELPEANAAEAVGRLPGVSLERSGGEGTKVNIRGMGAKYTKVQIDGVNMTATGHEDRSTDLSMISPYMLEGIELTKSIQANQEATATGGIVNFKIKKAPKEASFNLMAQGGHNNLRNTFNNYKLSVGASNRFFSNRFGLYGQFDYEGKDAGSQQLNVGGDDFSQENAEAPVRTNGMELREIFRNVERLGGAVVLDYTLPSTEIKSSNFYSRIKREETNYSDGYIYDEQGFTMNYTDTPKRWLTVLTNSLQIDHQWNNWELNTNFSHSYSENILPAEIYSSASSQVEDPFPTNRTSKYNVNLDPETIPDSLAVSMDEAVNFMTIGGIEHDESKTLERNISGEFELSRKFNITDKINVNFNIGGKYRRKDKEYDKTALRAENEGANQSYRNLVYETFEDQLSERTKQAWQKDNMRILLIDFFDPDYEGGDFLNDRYNFGYIFDKDKFRQIHDLVMEQYDPTSTSMYDMVLQNYIETNFRDYHGNEDYYAFYLMPEIKFGSKITLVPGVRYESNRTEYTGYRGNRLGVLYDWRKTPIDTVTKVRENEFILPMIQAVYKPTDWMNLKAGYTNTLQRPNYNNIMPGWFISNMGRIDNLSNFRLKPELSENYDLQMSIFSDKIGLFSVGAFYKEVTDMIFWTGTTAILDTSFFELPTLMHRQRAAYAANSENEAINYGYELEWQSNFWYLPGLLNGLVMNVNYTRNISEAKYPKSRIETKAEYDENFNIITYYESNDTTYTAPMLSQPAHLLNLTVGYDFKGFSIRWAMRYKSKIFTKNNWYEKLRGYSTDFYRYDLSIKQELPLEGMELFLNVNNLTNELEHSVINHMDFTSYKEDYGRSANIGIRYNF